jgi:hypothetical protein
VAHMSASSTNSGASYLDSEMWAFAPRANRSRLEQAANDIHTDGINHR